MHQLFIQTYNTTAYQGLLKAKLGPRIPLQVLRDAKGHLSTPDELARKFSRALFPRTTNRHGCATLHSYHCYVAEGLPKTPVLLWVYGEQLRTMVDMVVLAAYRCRYDWRTQTVHAIHEGSFSPTRFTLLQGTLLPFHPQEFLMLYRPPAGSQLARMFPRSNYCSLSGYVRPKGRLHSPNL